MGSCHETAYNLSLVQQNPQTLGKIALDGDLLKLQMLHTENLLMNGERVKKSVKIAHLLSRWPTHSFFPFICRRKYYEWAMIMFLMHQYKFEKIDIW